MEIIGLPLNFGVLEWYNRTRPVPVRNIDDFWNKLPSLPCLNVGITIGLRETKQEFERMVVSLLANTTIQTIRIYLHCLYPDLWSILTKLLSSERTFDTVCINISYPDNCDNIIKCLCNILSNGGGARTLYIPNGLKSKHYTDTVRSLCTNTRVKALWIYGKTDLDYAATHALFKTNRTLETFHCVIHKSIPAKLSFGKSLKHLTISKIQSDHARDRSEIISETQFLRKLPPTLETLSLHYVNLHTHYSDTRLFLDYIRNTKTLWKFDLGGIYTDTGTDETVIRALAENTSITHLTYRFTFDVVDSIRYLSILLENNTTLLSLHLYLAPTAVELRRFLSSRLSGKNNTLISFTTHRFGVNDDLSYFFKSNNSLYNKLVAHCSSNKYFDNLHRLPDKKKRLSSPFVLKEGNAKKKACRK